MFFHSENGYEYGCYETIAYYYDEENNILMSDSGYTIHNIFSVVTPSQYALFKWYKDSTIFKGAKGTIHEGELIELIWPENIYQ